MMMDFRAKKNLYALLLAQDSLTLNNAMTSIPSHEKSCSSDDMKIDSSNERLVSSRISSTPATDYACPAKIPSQVENKNTKNLRHLDPTFSPGPFDVICGRGKQARDHAGNYNFRQRVSESAENYSKATSKITKTLIVNRIIEWVEKLSPDGGFVKKVDGIWYCVGEELKREKVGQVLRELNSHKYKSSMKAKRRRWKQEKVAKQAVRNDDSVLNNMLQDHKETVTRKWQLLGRRGRDDQVLELFTTSNISLLRALKSNKQIQEHISKLV